MQSQPIRQSGQQRQLQSQDQQAQPHHSHSDPWALDFICCDAPHAASSSRPQSNHGTPVSGFSGGSHGYVNSNSRITSPINQAFPPNQPFGGTGDRRAEGECCADPSCGIGECCNDPTCIRVGCDENSGGGISSQIQMGTRVSGTRDGEPGEDLLRWACSKEGCDAIQQFPDCQIPTVPPPNTGTSTPGGSSSFPDRHYHMSNPIDDMMASLGGLQAPFLQNSPASSTPGTATSNQRQSSLFDGNATPNFGVLQSPHIPQQSAHQHNNSFHTGHQQGHNHQHGQLSHIHHNHQHQQLHNHAHNHSHIHMSGSPSVHQGHNHAHHRRHPHQHHASSSSFHHTHPHPYHPHQHRHSHSHSHSHSASISSMPNSTMGSPDILPWSNSSSALTPASTSSHHTPVQTSSMASAPLQLPIHVCHWQNCHLTFSSMPDLLGHVAADHLGASGFAPSNPIPPTFPTTFLPPPAMSNRITQLNQQSLQSQSRHQQLQNLSNPPQSHIPYSLNTSASSSSGFPTMPTSAASTPSTTSLPSLSALGITQQPSPSQIQAQAEQDRLLSCLWDDCFPLPNECSAEEPNQCPPHTHIPAPSDCTVSHPHSHTHSHLPAGGGALPFSPQTMLRHVLEEHLGVPGDILGWGADTEFGMENLAAGLMGGYMGTAPTLQLPPPSMMDGEKRSLDQMMLGMSEGGAPLPTPPESNDSSIVSPPSISSALATQPKQLICQWHECDHVTPFTTSAELMDHLSEVHIGRGDKTYACMWGDCVQHKIPDDGQGDNDDESEVKLRDDEERGGEEDDTKVDKKVEGRMFSSRQKVLRHLQSHTGYKPFICHVCDQAFSEAAPLAAHMRRHNEEKPFVCEVDGCGKRFAISSSLTIHMRTHNGEKPFVCPHCQKGFVEASNLTKHIRTHTGERPFGCPHPGCEKRFPRPDQLKRHLLVHEKGRERKVRSKVIGTEVKA